ncbi:hypothetical protein FJY84_05805 [Candidatus Bathyarchaeota archaeon]|nr:hypothetical protein [Candidatus Bathyarchaeota archaeon]
MFEQLTTSPIPEYLLIAGGVIAVIIGIFGGKKAYNVDIIVSMIGFGIGFILIGEGIIIWASKSWAYQVWATMLVLGVGLFFRIFSKVPVALILSVILASLTYVFLGFLALPANWTLFGAAIVFFATMFFVGSVESLVDTVGKILGWRPVLFILGCATLIVAFLTITGYF